MGSQSKIQWTDSTFNPWIGCSYIDETCVHCYAEVSTPSKAFGVEWGQDKLRRRTSESNWNDVLRWEKDCKDWPFICPLCDRKFKNPDFLGSPYACECGGSLIANKRKVFCASLADWLDDADVLLPGPGRKIDRRGILTLCDLLTLIQETPNLYWLLLSKRVDKWWDRLFEAGSYLTERGLNVGGSVSDFIEGWTQGQAPTNVWIGTSIGTQKGADDRIPDLLRIPAKVRFLSVEPLLEPIDLAINGPRNVFVSAVCGHDAKIDWVIVGGESGAKARPCNIDWIRSIVQQCKASNTACFVKQLGSNPHCQCGELPANGTTEMRHPKGGDPSEWPEDLRVQQFPQV